MDAIEKSAILLFEMGEERAANVLKLMDHNLVQAIGEAMTRIPDITNKQVSGIFDEFISDYNKQSNIGIGAEEYLRKTMRLAVGEERANTIIDKILMGNYTKSLEAFKWMDAKSILNIIQFEHPQIITLILSLLDSEKASQVISLLPKEKQVDILLRISKLKEVQPAALQELNNLMEKQLMDSSVRQPSILGGIRSVADIINHLDNNLSEDIIEGLKQKDEEIVNQIKDKMFVFENLLSLDDRGFQTLLRDIASDVLMLALRGASEPLKEKVFKNMSKRAAELLKDDMEVQGPVKLSEVEAAQKEIILAAQKLAEAGEIMLGNSGGDMI